MPKLVGADLSDEEKSLILGGNIIRIVENQVQILTRIKQERINMTIIDLSSLFGYWPYWSIKTTTLEDMILLMNKFEIDQTVGGIYT